jgi:D-inositol-3-phosphate glycosyltransferase
MGKQLKVAIYEPSGSGGICHYTYQLAEALASLGIHTTVCTTASYELQHLKRTFYLYFNIKKSWLKSLLEGINIYFQGESIYCTQTTLHPRQFVNSKKIYPKSRGRAFLVMLRRWGTRLKAVGFFLRERPHIIHLQWLRKPAEDYYFIKLLHFFKFKILYTAHNILPHNDDSERTRAIFKKIYNSVDGIIVHATRNKTELIDEFHIDHEKITVIPHGSYDFFYRETKVSKESARCELKLGNNKKIIFFFGSIRKNKGLEYLIEAFKSVQENIQDSILLIVGNFVDKDEEGLDYHSALAERLRRCSGVVLVEQYIPVERVGHYFSAADVVVLPYLRVTQSGVLLLAYASGKPVVATDTGGLSEVVEDGKSGFVVPPRDADALAHAIIEVLQNPVRTEAMGKYAEHLAATVYAWKNVAVKTHMLYESVSMRENYE